MEGNRATHTRYLRYVHEFLFSLNAGLVTRWLMAQANYAESELTIKGWINRRLHLHPHSDIGGNVAFLVLALGVALGTFLLLRVLSRTAWLNHFLRSVTGIVSLVALPASWLYRAHVYRPVPGLPNPPHILLFLELAAATSCIVLYLYAKWPLPGWGSVALLILHFSLWGWLFLGGPYFWFDPLHSVFPLAGSCSVLAWALYVSQGRTVLGEGIAVHD